MLVVSLTGGALIGMGVLHNRGFKVNEDMMLLAIKLMAFGGIFWIFQILRTIFLF